MHYFKCLWTCIVKINTCIFFSLATVNKYKCSFPSFQIWVEISFEIQGKNTSNFSCSFTLSVHKFVSILFDEMQLKLCIAFNGSTTHTYKHCRLKECSANYELFFVFKLNFPHDHHMQCLEIISSQFNVSSHACLVIFDVEKYTA